MQTKNLLLIGDFDAPNVNWNDTTTSCHAVTFDARMLSLCLDNLPRLEKGYLRIALQTSERVAFSMQNCMHYFRWTVVLFDVLLRR